MKHFVKGNCEKGNLEIVKTLMKGNCEKGNLDIVKTLMKGNYEKVEKRETGNCKNTHEGKLCKSRQREP